MNILLMGCGGTAGNNYVKSVKMIWPDAVVYGTDSNEYHLMSSNADVKIHIPHDENEKSYLDRYIDKMDFVHAQPDVKVLNLGYLAKRDHRYADKSTKIDLGEWAVFNDKLLCQSKWADWLGTRKPLIFSQADEDLFRTLKGSDGSVWMRARSGAGSKAALPVSNWSEAVNWYAYWVQKAGMRADQFMLSQYLPGPEYAVQMFYWEGELIHLQARERVEYVFGSQMPSGQSSSPLVARTVNDAALGHFATNALRAARGIDTKPHGIYCMDIKTASDGQWIPTEVNYGRYFTTMDFMASLGMNTPAVEIMLHLERNVLKIDTKYPYYHKINAIDAGWYWIRNLDKEPVLRRID